MLKSLVYTECLEWRLCLIFGFLVPGTEESIDTCYIRRIEQCILTRNSYPKRRGLGVGVTEARTKY